LSPEQLSKRRRDWLGAALDEADSFQRDSRELQDLPRDILYLMGDQWPTRRPSYKASPVNNRLLRSMEATVAILTDISPDYEVKANDDTFDDQAKLLTKTIKYWWKKNDVDFQLAMAVIYAYLTTGFLRIVWNRLAANGKGDFQVFPLSPYDLKPIGPAHNFQDWEGCIYEAIRPVAWFRRNFPGPGSLVTPDLNLTRYAKPLQRPRANMGMSQFEMLSPQAQRWIGQPREFGESALAQSWYREFWVRDYSINTSGNIVKMGTPGSNWYYEVKPNGPLYPRGRLIITGGADLTVMYDGPNYFWHGRFPFIPIRLKPVPWQFYGLSELRTKIPLQDIVNTILAGVLDMIKKAVNPPLLFPDNAFSDAVKNQLDPSMPNAKIGYNPMAASPPEYGNPPIVPSYVQNTLMYTQNEQDDDSGLLDLGGLARKKVTPAGDTLQGLKESQQTIMRLRGRYITLAIRDLGEQMTPNIIQFYPLGRRMWLFGRHGVTYQDVWDSSKATMIPVGRNPSDHAASFPFEIMDSSLLNLNKNDDQMLAMALRRQGDMDRETLFQKLDLSQIYEQVERNLEKEHAQMAKDAAAAQAGAAPPGAMPAHRGVGGDNPLQNLIGPS
jgi:hypothetical protein